MQERGPRPNSVLTLIKEIKKKTQRCKIQITAFQAAFEQLKEENARLRENAASKEEERCVNEGFASMRAELEEPTGKTSLEKLMVSINAAEQKTTKATESARAAHKAAQATYKAAQAAYKSAQAAHKAVQA